MVFRINSASFQKLFNKIAATEYKVNELKKEKNTLVSSSSNFSGPDINPEQHLFNEQGQLF